MIAFYLNNDVSRRISLIIRSTLLTLTHKGKTNIEPLEDSPSGQLSHCHELVTTWKSILPCECLLRKVVTHTLSTRVGGKCRRKCHSKQLFAKENGVSSKADTRTRATKFSSPATYGLQWRIPGNS